MHFKVSTGILSRLGEELIPNPDQGIMELVKNSYDADATECTVELIDTDVVGGALVVSDNGVGMDPSSISDGWLVIGRSKKADRKRTAMGRLPVGDKGLGRLAALRQGSHVTLKSRPAKDPGVEYVLPIHWQDFSQTRTVEEVPLDLKKQETGLSQGTDTIIENLKFKLGKREVQRLARELLLLSDPFDSKTGFRPKLIAPGFSELENRVRKAYFDDAEYHLSASLDVNGKAEAKLMDWKGDVLFEASHKNLSGHEEPYKAVSATLEVWVFLLNPQTFSRRGIEATITEVRNWLEIVGNVHLYYRELRVKPYGDQGNDWLNINLTRGMAPEARPSTKTVVGRLIVDDQENRLIQKTDRLGFIEDEAFSELKQFAVDAFDWMTEVRRRASEKKRVQSRRNISKDVEQAKTKIKEKIDALELPSSASAQIIEVVQDYEKTKEREVQSLREDVLLYRSLATAGTTAAVFSHESGKPVTLIERAANRISKQGKKLFEERYDEFLSEPVGILYRAINSLKSFSNFPLHLLKRVKRKSTTVEVYGVINGVINLFEPFLKESKITVNKKLTNDNPLVRGSVALLESVLVNLMTNALTAFNKKDAPCQERQIKISTRLLKATYIEIRFLDSASGIKDLDTEEIWLPGRTTTAGGTGLGLTIVKDSITDLGGHIQAISNGELGGAEFVITLPLVEYVK